MRLSAWHYLLSWMTATAVLFSGAAHADSPSSDSPNTIDFSKLSDPDEVHSWTLSAFYGYETFRGVSDGNWQNNGLNAGFNFGTRLDQFSDVTGIGFQCGASMGIYNWSGTDYRIRDNDQAETQGFFTVGFFRKATENCPWEMAAAYDLMVNNNFGVFNETPTLDQWRYQIGYVINDKNEIGVWGALHGMNSTRDVAGVGPVKWQGINQVDAFFHHKWGEGGPDTTAWVGVPEDDRLAGGGSLGVFIAGARADVPLSDWMSLYTSVSYMKPSAKAGPAGSEEDEWSFVLGLTIFFRHDSHTPTVAREGWAPLLPVASNGTFFVDTDHY